ncbi:enoyl-CoA hydratase/isomerase family protein [Cryptosporangium aurantiacum]|uniref:Enoyl-CoA hydratase n=1 Tax=Cryptosporangium aurantiacum TaxID=134849 RepID=A0A1M7R4P5_9ACTN|nr:enoyl-CoA hydratase/isomerase family protein [Cryptosporangium aurantiacum]SHN40092.1 enoyl-CoA hydratase [Cryptosporangium aurantiacum]
MTGDTVLLDVEDGVATVSFNRPHKHNAVDDPTAAHLGDLLRGLHGTPDVRAVVLRGEGPSFSSGRDTTALGTRARGQTDLEHVVAAQRAISLLSTMPFPVVAALKGWVLGGSFERALHCDIRIAAEDARMALPEVGFGLIPDTGGAARLRALAGPGLAKDMVLTGRVLTAAEALTAGVVSRVVPAEELDGRAQEIARTLAQRSPLAIRLAREVLDEIDAAVYERAMHREALAQAVCFASADYQEIRAARREDRVPALRGR